MDNSRTRNWVFIVYPENICELDLDEYLSSLNIECVRSPLHHGCGDHVQDERKDHWHVLFCFDGVKSITQVMDLIQPLQATRPVPCHSVRGSVRYFVHADNPEKEQFDRGYGELVSYGGINVFDLFCPTSAEKDGILANMQQWIIDNEIMEFSDLLDYSKEHYFDTWYYLLTHGSAHLMTIYICSRRNKAKGDMEDLSKAISYARADIIKELCFCLDGYQVLDDKGEIVKLSSVFDKLL